MFMLTIVAIVAVVAAVAVVVLFASGKWWLSSLVL